MTTPDTPIPDASDPLALFDRWFAEAGRGEPNDPNAMCLATADATGMPSARMVLLKEHDGQGFVFYTNLESRKGAEIAANPRAALLFHWKSLRRQVRIEGVLEPVTAEEADRYYASRGRMSQLGAHASRQSRPLDARDTLLRRVREAEDRFADDAIPRPADWSGFRLRPSRFEFWQDMPHRLHDRVVCEPEGDGGWTTRRLFP